MKSIDFKINDNEISWAQATSCQKTSSKTKKRDKKSWGAVTRAVIKISKFRRRNTTVLN